MSGSDEDVEEQSGGRKPIGIQIRCGGITEERFKKFAVPYQTQEDALKDLMDQARFYGDHLRHSPPPGEDQV